MNIAVIGASGFVGYAVTKEALEKNHHVKAIYRRNSIPEHQNLEQFKMTIFDQEQFKQVIKDVDVVISAYNPGYYHVDQKSRYLDAYEVIFNTVKALNKRIIVVIGATTLIQYDGELVKHGFYPKPWLHALEGPDAVFEKYRFDKSINVTWVSPAAELIDGNKTKNYRYDTDHLIYDQNFESRISVQDLAHAIILEAESPKYEKMRFTIAY